MYFKLYMCYNTYCIKYNWAIMDMGYTFNSCSDCKDEIERKIRALKDSDIQCFMEFIVAVDWITRYGVNRSERLETLGGQYDTYAYPLYGCKQAQKMILTRQIGTNKYIYLGLTTNNDPMAIAYTLACDVHKLKEPKREENNDL